jgi:hypothetical protein
MAAMISSDFNDSVLGLLPYIVAIGSSNFPGGCRKTHTGDIKRVSLSEKVSAE